MNLLPIAVVHQLIEEYEAHTEAMRPKREEVPPLGSNQKMGTSAMERYITRAVDGEYQILATTQAGKSKRYGQLLSSAARLASIANSDWGAPFLSSENVYAVLLQAATANGLVAKYGEAHLSRAIDWCLGNVAGRPEPQGEPFVPITVYGAYTVIGTKPPDEPDDWPNQGDIPEDTGAHMSEPLWRPSEAERAEIAELFPLLRDKDGRAIRPDMFEVARVRKNNPRRAATDLVISNSWENPANAVYHRRQLFGFLQRAFREHLVAGGHVYKTTLRVPTATEDDAELLREELRAWDKIRKRLQRAESLYRWFSTHRPGDGVNREIYSSEPAEDGQEYLDDPEADLLDTVTYTTASPPPLIQEDCPDDQEPPPPYRRRKAHDGPADAWKPRSVSNGEWLAIGSRSSVALLEMNQDAHDEAAAAVNGIRSWRATENEVHGRSDRIIQTRHWQAPASKPVDVLPRLFEELQFRISWDRWDALFNDWGGTVTQEPPPSQMDMGEMLVMEQ